MEFLMRSISFALLAATVFAAPALAQERAPFTGAHVEGLVGWDRVGANGGHDDDIGYGVVAGYDRQFGRAIVGIEGEYSDSDVRACVGSTTVADPRLCAKAGRDLSIGARVGTVVGGRALLYAGAGYTNAGFKLTSDDGTAETTLGSSHLDGVRLKAGAEYAVGSNAYVKAEYRYSNYEQGISRNQVLGGFGVRF
jgi:outer membrane immunogenic protein